MNFFQNRLSPCSTIMRANKIQDSNLFRLQLFALFFMSHFPQFLGANANINSCPCYPSNLTSIELVLCCAVDGIEIRIEHGNTYGQDEKGMQRWGKYFQRESKIGLAGRNEGNSKNITGILAWMFIAILMVLILALLIIFFLYNKAKADERMGKAAGGRRSRRRGTLHILPKESIAI